MNIEPGYRIVRIRMHATGSNKLIDLDLQGVRIAGSEHHHNCELLRVDFPDSSPASTLWLQMKPDVTLVWSFDSML